MRFEFATANRIIFGPGTLREVGPLAASMGRRALVVTTPTVERAAPLLDLLAGHGVEHVLFIVEAEPSTDTARAGTRLARDQHCDLVIGIGGGSVIDTGKAVAALPREVPVASLRLLVSSRYAPPRSVKPSASAPANVAARRAFAAPTLTAVRGELTLPAALQAHGA